MSRVKQLLSILLGATVVFMALAVIQEWEVFAPALFPRVCRVLSFCRLGE